MPAAKKMAATIAGNAPFAVRACKKAINEGLQVSIDEGAAIEEEIFGSCFETYGQKEGMANFLRKKDDPKKVKKVAFLDE
jgi:enoyl-CoA hydratase